MAKKEFAGYRLLELLGSGGMGVTHLAVREGLAGFEKKVAIKKLPPHLERDTTLIQSLISEAKIAVLLDHPNIVSTYDLAKEGDEFFIVMEYVQGVNLSVLLKREKNFPLELVLYVVMEVLRALDYAHNLSDEQGKPLHIIHRDLSPDNLLLSVNGAVKLADFGLARFRNQIYKTLPGTIKGKFGYMSPEQVKGKALDARSDLFSLGVMLYEGLSRTRLFQEKNLLETLRRMEEADVPPLRQFVPDIDPQLEKIVTRSLAHHPEERYPNARDLYDELEAFIRPATIEQLRRVMQEYLEDLNHLPDGVSYHAKKSSSCASIQIFRPKKPLVYVLSQDSAFSEELLNALLDPWQGGTHFEFKLLANKEDIEAAQKNIEQYQETPYAVLFGGLFVAMMHPLLQILREREEICKVLVLPFANEELLEIAVNLCGLDYLLKAPFELTQLLSFLRENSRGTKMTRRISTVLTEARGAKKELQSQIETLAQANIHAVQLLDELERKNQVIKEKNSFLERIAKTVVKTNHSIAQSSQVFFQGKLSELPLIDLCQLMGLSRKTAVITLSHDEHEAKVFFDNGNLVHTKDGAKEGKEALFDLLDWRQGNFLVHSLQGTITRTINQPTTQLLLDLLRRKDEQLVPSQELSLPEGDWF